MSYDCMHITVFKDGHFHGIQIDADTVLTSHEDPMSTGIHTHVGGLDTLFERLRILGWDIVSAVVQYDLVWEEDLLSSGFPDFEDILYIHTEFLNNPGEINSMIAYMSEYGIYSLEDWEDALKISSDTKEGLAREWHDLFGNRNCPHPGGIHGHTGTECTDVCARALEIPSYLAVDWEASADSIAADNSNTICQCGGKWYMFS